MIRGNRSITKRVLSSPFTLVVAAVVFVLLTRAAWEIYSRVNVSDSKLGQAQNELARLENRQADLTAQIGHLSSEQGIEDELRSKYHAVKDGESVAVIIDDASTSQTDDISSAGDGQASSSTTENASWWRRFLETF